MQYAVWGILGAAIVAIVVLYLRNDLGARSALPVLNEVKPFSLTNQLEQPVSLADLKGDVWIADIIFTRCGGPCPKMTEKMSELQHQLPTAGITFVTLTADPKFDTARVLKAYAERFKADHSRWHFLTGDKAEINQLAVKGLLLTSLEKEESQQEDPNDLFVHSTTFVLVDKRGRIRGVYESLEEGFKEKIVNDAKGLLRERAR